MPIRISAHARQQMLARGATEAEVRAVIERGQRESALRQKFKARLTFSFNRSSPTNNQTYRFKTVEAIWAEDFDDVTVVTVLVYYSDEERAP